MMETTAQPPEPQPARQPLEIRVRAAPAGAVGRSLAQLRQERGLTVDALAKRSGVAVRVILALERGTCRYPGGTSLLALADGVGTNAETLLRDEDGRGPLGESNRDRRAAGARAGGGDGRGREGRDTGRARETGTKSNRAGPNGSNRRRGGKRAGGSANRTRPPVA